MGKVNRNRRLQSAMEYLMTYGWAILIIAIVLAALFLLGVFNSPLGSHCIAGAPFSCSTTPAPVMATNGLLSLTLGQATGGPIYFGGAACSSAASSSGLPLYGNGNVVDGASTADTGNIFGMPTNALSGTISGTVYSSSESPIQSSTTFVLSMTCYAGTPQNNLGNSYVQYPLGGTPFTGTIWLNYSSTSAIGPWSVTPITTTFSVKPTVVSSYASK